MGYDSFLVSYLDGEKITIDQASFLLNDISNEDG